MTPTPLAAPPPLANKIDMPLENAYAGIPSASTHDPSESLVAETHDKPGAAISEETNAGPRTANLYTVDENHDLPPQFGDKSTGKDFLAQVSDMAFGPDFERVSNLSKANSEKLVEKAILPDFKLALGPEINLPSLNPNNGHSKNMLNHYNERYFALRSDVGLT